MPQKKNTSPIFIYTNVYRGVWGGRDRFQLNSEFCMYYHLSDCFAVSHIVLEAKKKKSILWNNWKLDWIVDFGINCTYFIFKVIDFILLNFIVYLKMLNTSTFQSWWSSVGSPACHFLDCVPRALTDILVNTKHCLHIIGLPISSARVCLTVPFVLCRIHTLPPHL